MSGFTPFGARGNRGPIGERLFDRPALTQQQIAEALAATHPAAQVVEAPHEVVAFEEPLAVEQPEQPDMLTQAY